MAVLKKAEIRQSLIDQLKLRGADQAVFVDVVNEYMELWDARRELQKDIKKRGAVYQGLSSTGIEREMNNPSVKERINVSRQMMSILKELNLTPDQVLSGEDDEL